MRDEKIYSHTNKNYGRCSKCAHFSACVMEMRTCIHISDPNGRDLWEPITIRPAPCPEDWDWMKYGQSVDWEEITITVFDEGAVNIDHWKEEDDWSEDCMLDVEIQRIEWENNNTAIRRHVFGNRSTELRLVSPRNTKRSIMLLGSFAHYTLPTDKVLALIHSWMSIRLDNGLAVIL